MDAANEYDEHDDDHDHDDHTDDEHDDEDWNCHNLANFQARKSIFRSANENDDHHDDDDDEHDEHNEEDQKAITWIILKLFCLVIDLHNT